MENAFMWGSFWIFWAGSSRIAFKSLWMTFAKFCPESVITAGGVQWNMCISIQFITFISRTYFINLDAIILLYSAWRLFQQQKINADRFRIFHFSSQRKSGPWLAHNQCFLHICSDGAQMTFEMFLGSFLFLSSGQIQIRWCFKQTEAASDLKGIHSLWALIFTLSYNQQISKTIKLHCNVFLYAMNWNFFVRLFSSAVMISQNRPINHCSSFHCVTPCATSNCF